MTDVERWLLCRINRWLRQGGPSPTCVYGYETPDGVWRVSLEQVDECVIGMKRGRRGYFPTYFHWLPTVASIAQGVDVLVAYGVLPHEFSSAYVEGARAAVAELGVLERTEPSADALAEAMLWDADAHDVEVGRG